MKQSTAVTEITKRVFEANGVTFHIGMDVKPTIASRPHLRDQICEQLMSGFRSGEIDLKGGPNRYVTAKELKSYVVGLMSNWYRKGKELNGNVEYEPTNPGSRTGVSDPQLKNLKLLYNQTEDELERLEIQGFINTRLSEIKTTKVKAIDYSVLPAELQAKFKK